MNKGPTWKEEDNGYDRSRLSVLWKAGTVAGAAARVGRTQGLSVLRRVPGPVYRTG